VSPMVWVTRNGRRVKVWRRPATDFPNKVHANNVADLVHAHRVKSDADQAAWFDALEEGEGEKD
jgi:hypothetical protein